MRESIRRCQQNRDWFHLQLIATGTGADPLPQFRMIICREGHLALEAIDSDGLPCVEVGIAAEHPAAELTRLMGQAGVQGYFRHL